MAQSKSSQSVVKKLMTPADASRIQSVTASRNGGRVEKDSFAARALSAAALNQNGKAVVAQSKSSQSIVKKSIKPADASRIQGTTAVRNGGRVEKDSFAARVLSAAALNENRKVLGNK